jgi:excisionase family DNA binding protein
MTALLTARSVAETLGVSAETVLRWTRRGDLPALRLPSGAIRYRQAALDQWLSARELPHNDGGPAGENGPSSQLQTPLVSADGLFQ